MFPSYFVLSYILTSSSSLVTFTFSRPLFARPAFLSSDLRCTPPAAPLFSASASASPAPAMRGSGKTILITGATDGIGLETALHLASQRRSGGAGGAHTLLLHGRSRAKLQSAEDAVRSRLASGGAGEVETYLADLSDLAQVRRLAADVRARHASLDVLVNNAGVLQVPRTAVTTTDGLDVRFAVNTIAPYILTRDLLPALLETNEASDGDEEDRSARVINISSAAQSPVSLRALAGKVAAGSDMSAYAQSKLAIAMWTKHMAHSIGSGGNIKFIALNPGSLLNTKMVRDGFGYSNNGVEVGADIVVRAALSDEFADANGKYYDNDAKRFTPFHQDARNAAKNEAVVREIEGVVENIGGAAARS